MHGLLELCSLFFQRFIKDTALSVFNKVCGSGKFDLIFSFIQESAEKYVPSKVSRLTFFLHYSLICNEFVLNNDVKI